MKLNKKGIIAIFISALLFSLTLYTLYSTKNKPETNIYLMQVGAYKNYDNVVKMTRDIENYGVLKENNLYKIFIGVTKDDEVYNKLLDIYGKDLSSYKKVIKVSDEELDEKINKYDKLISKINSKEELDLIIKEELKMITNVLGEKV